MSSLIVIFHPDAAVDLADAAAWYDRQQLGLGDEFEAAVLIAADRIGETSGLVTVVRAWRGASIYALVLSLSASLRR